MSETKHTPITNAQAVDVIGFYSCATVPASLSRKLESDRAKLLDACKEARMYASVGKVAPREVYAQLNAAITEAEAE